MDPGDLCRSQLCCFLSFWSLHQVSLWLWRSLLQPTTPYSFPETGDKGWMTHAMFSPGTSGINLTLWSKYYGSSFSCKGTLNPYCWTWDEAPAVWSVAGMTLSLPVSSTRSILPWCPFGAEWGTFTTLGPCMSCSCNGSCASEKHHFLWVLSRVIQIGIFFGVIALWSLTIIFLTL